MTAFPRVRAAALAVLVLLPALARAEAPAGKPRVYVLKPKLLNIAEAAGSAITDAVAQAAADEGLQALSEADVKEVLGHAAQLQALGADADELSLGALARTAGAEYLLAVTVSSLGTDSRVFVRLIDAKASSVLSRRELSVNDSGGEVLKTVQAATRLALAPIFAGQKGTVTLKSSEEGANVLIDGEQVGVTPVGTLTLTGGAHLLAVTKESFIRHQQLLHIGGGEVLLFDVKLRPSVDFLNNYRVLETRHRRLAWAGTVVGAVLVGATVFTALQLQKKNDAVDAVVAQYNALPPDQQQQQLAAFDVRTADAENSASSYQDATYGAGGGAVVAGLVAAYFWIFGEDPERYSEFEGAAAK